MTIMQRIKLLLSHKTLPSSENVSQQADMLKQVIERESRKTTRKIVALNDTIKETAAYRVYQASGNHK